MHLTLFNNFELILGTGAAATIECYCVYVCVSLIIMNMCSVVVVVVVGGGGGGVCVFSQCPF